MASQLRSLVVSGFDPDFTIGGGLFVVDRDGSRCLDRISSMGLDYTSGLFRRVVWSELGQPTELLVYDDRGLVQYLRIDDISNAHDVCRWMGETVVVATEQNQLVWISDAGQVTRRWEPAGDEPDSWHLNSLTVVDDALLVSAFGRFPRRKGWDAAGRPPTGCLVDVETGSSVLDGLLAPHNPTRVDDSWFVCNAASFEVLQLDLEGNPIRAVNVGGWCRGLALEGDVLYVGVSQPRRSSRADRPSAVAVVDLDTFRVDDVWPVPVREIYDLCFVDPVMVGGLEIGAKVNASRHREEVQLDLFRSVGVEPQQLWAISEPLGDQARVEIGLVDAPASMAPSRLVRLCCRVTNLGDRILTPAPPYPVRLKASLTNHRTDEPEAFYGALVESVPPQGTTLVYIYVRAPDTGNTAELTLSLDQVGAGPGHGTAGSDEARYQLIVRPDNA